MTPMKPSVDSQSVDDPVDSLLTSEAWLSELPDSVLADVALPALDPELLPDTPDVLVDAVINW